jgi:hypothetical protein
MASIFQVFAAESLMLLSVTTVAAGDLDDILSMLEQRVGIQCEYRRLFVQYQKARDPAEQRALEQRLNEVTGRGNDAERSLQGKNFEAKAQAMSKADQLRMHEHAIAVTERCNATLPPEARMLLP